MRYVIHFVNINVLTNGEFDAILHSHRQHGNRAAATHEREQTMTTYKIRTTRDNLGNHGWSFVDSQGKAHNFKMVGRTWKLQTEGWSARRTVILAGEELLAVGKRTAAPLKMAEGEVFLPLSKTGTSLLLAQLPE